MNNVYVEKSKDCVRPVKYFKEKKNNVFSCVSLSSIVFVSRSIVEGMSNDLFLQFFVGYREYDSVIYYLHNDKATEIAYDTLIVIHIYIKIFK